MPLQSEDLPQATLFTTLYLFPAQSLRQRASPQPNGYSSDPEALWFGDAPAVDGEPGLNRWPLSVGSLPRLPVKAADGPLLLPRETGVTCGPHSVHSCLYVLCEQRRALTLDHHLCRVLGGLASGLLSRCPEGQALFACDGGGFWGGTPREQPFEQLSLVMETAGPFAYPSNPHSNLPDPGYYGRSWLSAPQDGDMMRPQGHMFLNKLCQQGLGLPADDSGQEPLGLGLEALPAKEPPGRLH